MNIALSILGIWIGGIIFFFSMSIYLVYRRYKERFLQWVLDGAMRKEPDMTDIWSEEGSEIFFGNKDVSFGAYLLAVALWPLALALLLPVFIVRFSAARMRRSTIRRYIAVALTSSNNNVRELAQQIKRSEDDVKKVG